MSKIMLLCEKITGNKLLRDFFKNEGFTFINLDNIVCRVCGFQTRATLTISHIQFMHRLFNSKCEMVSYVCDKYENYGIYKLILNIDNYSSVKNVVAETEEMMRRTFRSWPKRLPRVEKLVAAGFYYTGVSDDVSCVECKIVLHDWQVDDNPWTEHEKTSPDCILVKLRNKEI